MANINMKWTISRSLVCLSQLFLSSTGNMDLTVAHSLSIQQEQLCTVHLTDASTTGTMNNNVTETN